MMHILIAFEFSARVRDAFLALGHDAWSCDLRPTEGRIANHLQGDVRWALEGRLDHYPGAVDIRTGRTPLFRKWDMMIAHPPCTRLTNSGVRWLHERDLWDELDEAVALFKLPLEADIPRICVENPIPHGYAADRIGVKYTQIVQPWWFGDKATKATCLWLKNLPKLVPTSIVPKPLRKAKVHLEPPGPDREKNRSRTEPGVAGAMASQWGMGSLGW